MSESEGTVSPVPESSGGESRNDLRRERTREQILEGACAALVRVGYERVTTREIARAAGVNLATLHYYFGTRDALIFEAVQYTLDRNIRQLRVITRESPNAAIALERAFQHTWEMVKNRPGVLRYDLVLRGLRDPKAHQQVTIIYRAFHSLVKEILERHIAEGHRLAPDHTIEILSQYLVASVDGVVLQHLIFGDDEKTKGCLSLILQHAQSVLMEGHSKENRVTSEDANS